MAGEFELIRRYFSDARADGFVQLAVGDDCALLAPSPGMQLTVSTDTLVGGVHFPADTSPADIGWKALAVNLSDLAACGATPRACFLAITLPSADESFVAAFAEGFRACAAKHACVLAGGDTTRGPLSVTVTVLGEVPAGTALLRGGARPGDLVCVSGHPGEAALALARWQQGERVDDEAQRRLLRPAPRVLLGDALRGMASAAIDISDGLLADLGHVLERSAGNGAPGATLQVDALPARGALAALPAGTRLQYQLAGGDDYELCFTLPPVRQAQLPAIAQATGVPLAVIGVVDAQPGLRLRDAAGAVALPARAGWEHFA